MIIKVCDICNNVLIFWENQYKIRTKILLISDDLTMIKGVCRKCNSEFDIDADIIKKVKIKKFVVKKEKL